MLTDLIDSQTRRRYPRVSLPIYCRPAHLSETPRKLLDIGLGGVRVYSDVNINIDERLSLDLYLPDDSTIHCLVRVAWVRPTTADAPARYEVGLQFIEVDKNDLQKLATILATEAQE